MTGAQPKSAHSRELYINGQWRPQSGANCIDVLSASTEAVIGAVPEGTPQDVDLAAKAAHAAFDAWSQTPVAERAGWLRKLAAALQSEERRVGKEGRSRGSPY